MSKRIFYFWEPLGRMPGYLNACIKTWQLGFPDYEIVALDYSNIGQWLTKDDVDFEWVKSHYGLPQKADVFRIALLKKYGGIWFDVDTVVTSSKARDLLGDVSRLTMFGNHISCLSAPLGDTVINAWYLADRRRIAWHQWYRKQTPFCAQAWSFVRRAHRFGPGPVVFRRWDFVGNSPLKHIVRRFEDGRTVLDRIVLKSHPEAIVLPQMDARSSYENFYFRPEYANRLCAEAASGCGVVLLHNGWTPKWVKKMSEAEFMASDLPLAKLINEVFAQHKICGEVD